MKNEKGITLVALIVTVVVMIILAAFSIRTAFNNKEKSVIQDVKSERNTQNVMEENQAKTSNALLEYQENEWGLN